jgi:hypothetical protein
VETEGRLKQSNVSSPRSGAAYALLILRLCRVSN